MFESLKDSRVLKFAGKLWDFGLTTFNYYLEHKAPTLAAALAFYTTFSLAPTLLIALAVAEFLVGDTTPKSELAELLRVYLTEQATQFALSAMASSKQHITGGAATLVGLATAFFGATAVFLELRYSLNFIWDVRYKRGSSLWRLVYDRFISFLTVIVIGVFLVLSLAITTALTAIDNFISLHTPIPPSLLNIPNALISYMLVPLLLALIYRLLPDTHIEWKDVWLGVIVTALLFALGRYAFGLYLGRTTLLSIYGAAGSFVVILLWVYYSSMALLLGAELTRVYSEFFGSRSEGANGSPVETFTN
jgi:membrane protein